MADSAGWFFTFTEMPLIKVSTAEKLNPPKIH
jgi:hypothetical protein